VGLRPGTVERNPRLGVDTLQSHAWGLRVSASPLLLVALQSGEADVTTWPSLHWEQEGWAMSPAGIFTSSEHSRLGKAGFPELQSDPVLGSHLESPAG
jgi:hypothetical protein